MTAFSRPRCSSAPAPAEEGPRGPPTGAAAPLTESPWRRRLRLVGRGFAAFALLFILLVGWLAITAPLSKSLEPIAPPELTLLASDGTPIARTGASVETPIAVAQLPEHVTRAFLPIAARRFYSHRGLDPPRLPRSPWTHKTS